MKIQKRSGENYADVLARKRLILEAIEKSARDATVMVEANMQTQREMWLMICSLSDAYGIGKERIKLFFDALHENAAELERMRKENDDDYAFEKLRQMAEKVTGSNINYIHEGEK